MPFLQKCRLGEDGVIMYRNALKPSDNTYTPDYQKRRCWKRGKVPNLSYFHTAFMTFVVCE